MNDDKVIQSAELRLNEIDKEISEIKEKYVNLKEHWTLEKSLIQNIRQLKEEIEQVKLEAEQFERQGEFAKVAEIRYGKTLQLENKLKATNEKLAEAQKDGKLLKEKVDAEDIAEIVAKWTGIPVQRMLETERTKLLKIEERLHERVIGQNDAVTAIANSIRRSRAGLSDPRKPIGSFIFLGTTGVGKTEMARALAEYLFDDEHSIVRIDMSEYTEKFSVSRLLGAPPGYVGYEEGGQLTEAVRRKPYSVILLDEIEKAHIEVFNVLLQVLDDGRLTDGKGRTVNFKNTIIIMTSNIGTDIIQDKLANIDDHNRSEIISILKKNIIEKLRKTFKPEFLNRIDEIILFNPLTRKEIQKIAELQLNILIKQLEENGIKLEITKRALEWLAKIGFDPQFGARPMKRAIQKHIVDVLALKLLSSEFASADNIRLDANDNGEFTFNKV